MEKALCYNWVLTYNTFQLFPRTAFRSHFFVFHSHHGLISIQQNVLKVFEIQCVKIEKGKIILCAIEIT